MSVEGFSRVWTAAWNRVLNALGPDQAICVRCGRTLFLDQIADGQTPCCGVNFVTGPNHQAHEKAGFVGSGQSRHSMR